MVQFSVIIHTHMYTYMYSLYTRSHDYHTNHHDLESCACTYACTYNVHEFNV